MEQLSQTVQDVPLAGMIPLVLLLMVGLLLWAAGAKVFRAGFAAAGFLLGGGLGWLIGGAFNLGVPAWVVAIIGACLVGCLAALTYRLAIAGALAIVLGTAAPLAVLMVSEIQGSADSPPTLQDTSPHDHDQPSAPADKTLENGALDDIDRWLRERFDDEVRKRLPATITQQLKGRELDDDLAQKLADHAESDGEKGFFLNGALDDHIDAVRTMAERIAQALREAWNDAPAHLRPVLLGAAIVGGLLGVLIGALIPTFSTSIVTAFLGSLLALGSVRVISERLGIAETVWLPDTGTAWLILWVVIGLLGLAIQWTFLRRKADK
jgi:hypothetical protein